MTEPGDADAPAGRGESLSLTREETRTTFEYQVQRLQEIDSKAIEILKANLLLIGIIVTAGSILVQTEFEVGPFLNAFTAAGGLLLFVSTGLAGVTYTASNLRGGLDADAIERAVAADADRFEERLLRSYGRWIEHNAQVTAVNDVLITATVLLVIVSFAYVVAGAVVATVTLSTAGTAVAFVAFTVPVAWLTRVAYHMDHLGASEEGVDATAFPGVRLSKGATRAEGLEALRRMASGPGPSEGPPDDGRSDG